MSLRERNKLRTRRSLLDAALEIFAEQGFGSASVEAIAARAGASKVTVYSYFPDGREELFRQLYDEINTELLDRALALWGQSEGLVDRVSALVRALLEIGARPLVGRFYSIDDPALEVALNPVRGHASGTFLQLISTELDRCHDAGELSSTADPDALARLLVGASRAALTEVARRPERADELLEAFADLIRGLLGDGDDANTAAASNAPDTGPALDQPPAVAPPG
jgi:AcrR family transcriptional regulator